MFNGKISLEELKRYGGIIQRTIDNPPEYFSDKKKIFEIALKEINQMIAKKEKPIK